MRSMIGVLAALATSVAPSDAQSVLAIENSAMRISVLPDKGGLNELIHKPSGINLRNRTTGASKSIWNIKLTQSDGTAITLSNASAATFKGSVFSDQGNTSLDLTWQGFAAPLGNAVVHATITLPTGDSAATWKWDAQNLGGLVLNWVIYPNITGVGPLTAKHDVFIAPQWNGRLSRNPIANKISYYGAYPAAWMNMQFIALSSPLATFSLRAQDAEGYYKQFNFAPTTSTADDYNMQVWHYFDLASAPARVSIPYDVTLRAFTGTNGDWTDVAEDYKKWAYEQTWVQQGPFAFHAGMGGEQHSKQVVARDRLSGIEFAPFD